MCARQTVAESHSFFGRSFDERGQMQQLSSKERQSKIVRLKPPKITIAVQFNLFIVGLAVALLLIAAVSWIDAGQQAVLRYQNEIQAGLQVFDADFNRATRDLSSLGTWLVGQKILADLIQSRDSVALARYLDPWTEVNIADSILVVDKDGTLLTQVGVGTPVPQGSNATSLLGLSDALSGKKTSGLAPDASGRLQGRVVFPVYSQDAPSPVGAILLGFYLDGNFLKYQSRMPDQQIAVVYADEMSILTLTDSQGTVWVNPQIPAQVLRAQGAIVPTDFLTIQTDNGKYLFKFEPMMSQTNARDGMYGIGVSLESIDQERLNLFRTFGIGILAVALGGSLIGFAFARALTWRIRMLGAAAQAMAKGDLSRQIVVRREDELGDLARQMETMRQQLLQAFDSANLEKSRYAAVIRDMGVAAVITDQNLSVVSVNSVAEALLGQSEVDLRGKSFRSLFIDGHEAKSQAPVWVLGVTDGKSEPSLTARAHLSLRDRPQVTFEVISTVVELEGKAAGYVHILRDATSEEQLVRAQDEFIMNAAHELRGPLASLRASVELLVEDFVVMPQQEMAVMLKTLQRAIVKFQGLVENIIDIGNVQAGRFRIRPVPTSLETIISDALLQVGPLLTGRGQQARVILQNATASMVLADRSRIVQVLINLVTNASKYGPEGEFIDVSACTKDGFALVEVTDRGPGIAPEEQAHIFQRFYRGRRAEEEGLGIGLGLALAREIITAHGGQIDVNSKIGKGTTFWFTLPRVDQSS